MAEPIGVSVTIFMPDEEPNGLRFVEMLNWTGQGIVFPRSRFDRAKQEGALRQTGIYVLRGLNDEDRPVIYVGEADDVWDRLAKHYAKKDFWTQAAAFVSKDTHLNKAHVQYLEGRMWSLAKDANRCVLDNGNQPHMPTLSPADRAFAEHYLKNLQMCLSAVGVHEFESIGTAFEQASHAEAEIVEGAVDYTLTRQGADAKGYDGVGDGFVVVKGSLARKSEAEGFAADMKSSAPRKRRELIEIGVLVEDEDHPDHLVLKQDYPFNSPSQAAGVMVAGSVNGRDYWMKGNLTLKQWQAQQVGNPK